MTVSGWVRPADDGERKIVVTSRFGSSDGWITLRVDSDGSVVAVVSDGSTSASAASTTTVDDNNWHQLTMTASPSDSVSVYVDGSLESATSHTIGSYPINNEHNIGQYLDGSFSSDIDVAEYMWWDSEFSDTEVSDLYDIAVNPTYESSTKTL
jgi:hypothetical protein